ncbi:hypothetical protein Tco_0237553 [Tanacetum coccineum]
MAEYSQKWHNGTSRGRSTKTPDGLAVIQAQLNNLGREIKKVNEKVYAAQVGCEQCKGPHYTKDRPQKEEGKTLEEAYYTKLVLLISISKDIAVENVLVRIGALMNVPIFVGTFSVVIEFAVLEDMDAYHDEGMDDVIIGEPFLREVRIKARWFDGMITINNGDDEVTYQMVRSHPKFKHHTNEQCNKIPPLLKVSEHDKMNGISHSYQKLKRFYKGVLNLGPNFIRVPSMEEWLTHGHVSVHEME